MNLRVPLRHLTHVDTRKLERDRGTLTSAGLCIASLVASVVWFGLHDASTANPVGTAVIVLIPLCGLVHAFVKAGLGAILANGFALLVALGVAVLIT